ncbi:helix-turn-helix transcriptional regulator [Actinosynnema sp. CS-041913]|uniref:helix-turn-helix transcriptional regulator n=1 Tax=Actinosynnema sp. CS-041913 TaxID=3239917 RepID=UPI003D8F06F8
MRGDSSPEYVAGFDPGVLVRILVVVRNPVLGAGVAAVLGKRGNVETMVFPDGARVTAEGIGAESPDVVIVDVGRKRDLRELLRMRAERVISGVAVVAVLVDDRSTFEEMSDLLQSGVDGIVSAEDRPAHLVDVVEVVRGGARWISPALGVRLLDHLAERCLVHVRDSGAVDVPLTPSERTVLRMVADGHTDRQIAGRLQRSERTVKYHLGNLLAKFQASNRAHLVNLSIRAGALPVGFPKVQG